MTMIAPRRRRLVVIGNGMAGIRAVEEILARAPAAFAVTVFGAEPHGNYNRILLSPVLAGEKSFAEIVTHDRAWYETNGIELIAGEPAIAIDRAARTVTGAHGTMRPYDVLLLATGSDPVRLPLPGADLPGVVTFRDIADVETMLAASETPARAVVIGGGLLGLEAAHGLAKCGMDVTVLHLLAGLMERQLDPLSAGLLAEDLRRRGIAVRTEASTRAIEGEGKVERVILADGSVLPAALVVMAVGIRANAALARAARAAASRPADTASNCRSIRLGIRCTTVTPMPLRASPCAASSPSNPPPITTACPPGRHDARIADTSAMPRKPMTPGRSAPGTGRIVGSDPVASTRRS